MMLAVPQAGKSEWARTPHFKESALRTSASPQVEDPKAHACSTILRFPTPVTPLAAAPEVTPPSMTAGHLAPLSREPVIENNASTQNVANFSGPTPMEPRIADPLTSASRRRMYQYNRNLKQLVGISNILDTRLSSPPRGNNNVAAKHSDHRAAPAYHRQRMSAAPRAAQGTVVLPSPPDSPSMGSAGHNGSYRMTAPLAAPVLVSSASAKVRGSSSAGPSPSPPTVATNTVSRVRIPITNAMRYCISCGSTSSPCWRPSWSPTSGQLCNSCGLRYKKTGARCLAPGCGRIPSKGEWAIVVAHARRGPNGQPLYSCLKCNGSMKARR